MKISYNWLKEYVAIKLSPEKLAETLTMAGLSVESVKKSGDDHILEMEITANRPDWLSYIGVAREVAALTGAVLKIPKVRSQRSEVSGQIKIRVDDKQLCPKYTARVIRNIKVGPSPDWLKRKIEAMGLRPVNNIVDITNLCLFETGEPMHAFDLDKIEGSEITVRKARAGEKIRTIDGSERTLDNSTLVIADSKKPVAVAGIMGALNTEVTFSTKNILLEAACFDPVSVRRTSRKLALSTESSYRFERRVSIDNIRYSSDRAAFLIASIASGDAGEFIDIASRRPKGAKIPLGFEKLDDTLGVKVAPAKAKKILGSLGVKIKTSKSGLTAEPPDYRQDLKAEIDLIEEVARVYGYHNIPSTIPAVVEQPERFSRQAIIARKVRSALSAAGAYEIISYSLLNRKLAYGADHAVEIRNPLTNEQEIMRPCLKAGMLGAVAWNLNRKNSDLILFELGNVYRKIGGDEFSEKSHLSLAAAGDIRSNWAEGAREAGFFDVKGALDAVFACLGISGVSYKPADKDGFVPGSCASVIAGGEESGIIGEVSPAALSDFDIKAKVYYAEICLDAIAGKSFLEKHFTGIPKYPAVQRDLSIVVDRTTSNESVLSAVAEDAGKTLRSVTLIDRYAGKQVPDGKVSLTYRLEYRDPSRTLEEKEVSDSCAAVIQGLKRRFGANLR